MIREFRSNKNPKFTLLITDTVEQKTLSFDRINSLVKPLDVICFDKKNGFLRFKKILPTPTSNKELILKIKAALFEDFENITLEIGSVASIALK